VKLHILYRSTGSENSARRPAFYSKDVGFASFIRTLEAAASVLGDVVFLNDGPPIPPKRLAAMARTGQVIDLPGLGNSGSYRYALASLLTRPWPDEDLVYFSEDDYLYCQGALPQLYAAAQAISVARYFTPYDRPEYNEIVPGWEAFSRADAAYQRARADLRWAVGSTTWRAVRGTTMTFGARVGQLRSDSWIHLMYSRGPWPFDDLIWSATQVYPGSRNGQPALLHALTGHQKRLRSRVKSAWTALFDFVAKRGPLLIAPTPGLATHMHIPHIAPGVDWATVAADVAAFT
jgi:hypothetical protein